MWIITNEGFFSIVQKAEDRGRSVLTVRARVRADLENLQERWLPTLGPISEGTGTDYQFRAKASSLDIASALSQLVTDIDYDNFKNSVARKQGSSRAEVYGGLWSTLRRLKAAKPTQAMPNKMRRAYGGVVIDAERKV